MSAFRPSIAVLRLRPHKQQVDSQPGTNSLSDATPPLEPSFVHETLLTCNAAKHETTHALNKQSQCKGLLEDTFSSKSRGVKAVEELRTSFQLIGTPVQIPIADLSSCEPCDERIEVPYLSHHSFTLSTRRPPHTCPSPAARLSMPNFDFKGNQSHKTNALSTIKESNSIETTQHGSSQGPCLLDNDIMQSPWQQWYSVMPEPMKERLLDQATKPVACVSAEKRRIALYLGEGSLERQ